MLLSGVADWFAGRQELTHCSPAALLVARRCRIVAVHEDFPCREIWSGEVVRTELAQESRLPFGPFHLHHDSFTLLHHRLSGEKY
jgi:hypothetical protein